MKEIFNKVNDCLKKYIGGKIFFDKINKMIKFDKEILEYFSQKEEKSIKMFVLL